MIYLLVFFTCSLFHGPALRISSLSIWGCLVAQLVKNLPATLGNPGAIPVSGRFPGEGNGNPLQYSCLENSWTEEAGQATVHRVTKSPISPCHSTVPGM